MSATTGMASIYTARSSLVEVHGTGVPFTDRLVYPSLTDIMLELDWKIGLNYTYECGCWAITAQIGYELDYFWDGFTDRQIFPGNPAPGVDGLDYIRLCYHVGFGGPLFGASVRF